LLCAQEIPVEGSMPAVVRVLVHFHTDRAPQDVVHVYLDGAETLRDDLG
jgi:chorismate mutase